MTTPAAGHGPQLGEAAPDFDLPAHPSGRVRLADFRGKSNVILAFYPKDDTPGCTREMCAFSADLGQFADHGTVVLGVSVDDTASHASFAAKHNLSIPLLADAGGKVAAAYGAAHLGADYADRVLFLIDKQGIVRHVHHGMPTNLTLLQALQGLN
jgi:thioredoxin-dependent peroxiredoxin